MNKTGNDWKTLARKLYFYVLPTSGMRSRFVRKHKELFRHMGERVFWQPRQFPSDPELISIGNNVCLASGVQFVNHDVISTMLNRGGFTSAKLRPFRGCIEIGDNVMIGSNTLILPNVRIGSNVVVGAGSVVTKSLPGNGVWGGTSQKAGRPGFTGQEEGTILGEFS